MPHRSLGELELTPRPVRPWRLFALMLTLIFTIEYVVMLVLPQLVPSPSAVTLIAMVDSLGLAIFMAPALWVLVVVPLNHLSESRRQLLGRALMAQENERRRITRDIHDGIGQSLTSLMLRVRVIEDLSADPAIKQHARDIRELGNTLHGEVQQLLRGLRPMMLEHVGLAAALAQLVEEVRTASGIRIELEMSGFASESLTPEIETTLYRIVQEALSNAIQHGAPALVSVRLSTSGRLVRLDVVDDGRGFDAAAALRRGAEGSYGLLSMRERAMLHHGTVSVSSEPGAGTSILVRIPVPLAGAVA